MGIQEYMTRIEELSAQALNAKAIENVVAEKSEDVIWLCGQIINEASISGVSDILNDLSEALHWLNNHRDDMNRLMAFNSGTYVGYMDNPATDAAFIDRMLDNPYVQRLLNSSKRETLAYISRRAKDRVMQAALSAEVNAARSSEAEKPD